MLAMKIRNAFVTVVSACGLFFTVQSGFAQGSLAPPGAPGPTMLTLSQVEPRTPISSPTNITAGGSYYLTTNIVDTSDVNGININANNVTLDLSGFTVQGPPYYAVSGIAIPSAQTNITVRNGTIIGWENDGVYSASPASSGLVFERLNVSANGDGIYLYGASMVRDCNCQTNNQAGIVCEQPSLISGCTAEYNNGDGIGCIGGTITGCVIANNIIGMFIEYGTVSGCLVESNQFGGILVAGAGCGVIGNTCIGNNTFGSMYGAGIYIQSGNNRIENNQVTASGYAGIYVTSGYSNNIIIKNSVIGNGANNYLAPAGNDLGPVGSATNSTSPWANISH
jgi:parallel beta-helix repeat protein